MITVQRYPRDITGKSHIDDSKELDCFICDVKKQNWKEHKISILHTLNLQYFFQSFNELSENEIKCKLCQNQIPKSSLKKHARKIHKLIPWHKPTFKPIAYFTNFIKPIDKTSNCLLCNETFKKSALTHIKDPKHQHLLKDYIKETISIQDLKISCTRLVANYIYPYRTTQFQCLVCNVIIEGYNAANKHIADDTHEENLSTKDINTISLDDPLTSLFKNLKVCDSKICSSGDSAENSQSESRASTSSGYESTFNIKDVNVNDNNSDNDDEKSDNSNEIKLAESKVLPTSNKPNISSKNQKIEKVINPIISNYKLILNWTKLENLILQFFENYVNIRDNDYFCNLCAESYSSLSSMSTHLNDSKHKDLLLKKQQKTDTDGRVVPHLPNFIELLIRNNIFLHSLKELKCFSCQTVLPTKNSAEEHIISKLHRRNCKSAYIFSKEPDERKKLLLPESKTELTIYFKNYIEKGHEKYYCHLCQSTFTSLVSVMMHIKTLEHCKHLSAENSKSKKIHESHHTLYFYELCVRNGIFGFDPTNLKCFGCNGCHVMKTMVESHIECSVHRTTMSSECFDNEKIKSNIDLEEKTDDNIQLISVNELEENFIKFFENFIFVCDNFYCCTLCKTNSFFSSSMLLHINDSNHQNRLKKRRQELGISNPKVSNTPNFYELLVRNNIFQFDSLKFNCSSCEYTLTKSIDVEDHINSKLHKNNLQCTFVVMSALIPIGRIDKSSFDAHMKLPETKKDFSTYFGNLIEKCPENYYCHLCSTILPSWVQVMTHIEIPCHLNVVRNRYVDTKIQKSLFYSELCARNSIFCCSPTKFKCYTCEKVMSSEEEIEKHVENEHQQKSEGNKSSSGQIVNLHPPEVDSIKETSRSTVEQKISKLQSAPHNNLENQFIKCFENFICIFKKFYHCSLCNKNFISSSDMLSHTNGSKHINLLDQRRKMYDIKEPTIYNIPNFYELLVQNNIIQFYPRNLECLSCQCAISGYCCAEEHIYGYNHLINHKNTCDKMLASTSITSGKKNTDAEIILPDSKENFAQYFSNFIEKRLEDYYCHLCCVNLSLSEVKVHMKIPEHIGHVKSHSKYEKIKDVLFYSELCVRNSIFSSTLPGFKCFTCKVNIGLKKNIETHVKSEEHKTNYNVNSSINSHFKQPVIPPQSTVNVTTKSTITTDVKSNSCTPSSSKLPKICDQFLELFKNFVFIRQENTYFCNYCKISIPKSDTRTHINKLLHLDKMEPQKNMVLKACNIVTDNNFEKLVRNNIFPYNSTTIKCYLCDGAIHPYKNVDEHIEGRRHQSAMSKFQTPSVAAKKLKPEKPASNSKKSNKNSSGRSNILSYDVYKYDDTKRDFLSCNVCRKKINSRNVLHVHLTGHFWQLFIDLNMEDIMALAKLEPGNIVVSKDQIVGQASLNYTEKRDVLIEKESKADNQKSNKAFRSKVPEKDKKLKDDQQKRQGGRKITLNDLDVDENKVPNTIDIYEINEELHNMIQLSLSRVCIVNNSKIYCMICRKDVEYSLQTVYEHFRSLEHSYFIMQMIQDHAKFEDFPKEFSDFKLAREMIEDKSDKHAVCFVCNPVKPILIANKTESIKHHINSEKHQSKKAELKENLQKFVDNLNSRLERSWFNVQRFWCVICNDKFRLEHKFCKHLKSVGHNKRYQKFVRFEDLIYDFCPTCGVLYYGFKNTFTYHSNCEYHKFYLNKNLYLISQLPQVVEELVKNAGENLMNKLKDLENNEPIMKKEEKLLLKDLKVAINNYGNAKIYPFGSRMTGLGSMNSDLDIFLDCYDSYYKGSELEDVYQQLTDVEGLLKKNKKIWTIKRTVLNCRIPIIKLIHNTTNIDCDISFTNGLTAENTKLVKLYVDKFSMCKKLILFMRDWINVCNFSGEDGISSYAIAWMVIYYFQTKFVVPSVATLIKNEEKSRMIGGWETGVPKELTLPDISINYSFKDLLKGFFIMCAGFDYKNNVMCPLLGRPIKKIDLTVLSRVNNLPDEMVPYKKYIRKNHKNNKLEAFRSDSIMCIQDPFDLSHNLTKAVKKFIMHRFRTYCAMSAELNI